MLLKQMARVIAFMEYQAKHIKKFNVGCSIQMQAASRYMYRELGFFAQELERLLNDESKHKEIPEYVSAFRSKLRSEQDSFRINERAALYNISDAVEQIETA